MKRIQFIISLIITFNFSCSNNDSEFIQSLWIDSERVNCVGIDIQTCYRVQENKIIDENEWQLFYQGIEGFDEQYEEGFIYQLSINKIKIKNPSADGSSSRYVLINIMSKTLDE